MIEAKIQQRHLSKLAYVYLRQSTMGQVRFNQESTERQYALQDKAQQMGWPSSAIKVLDGDLGISGTSSHNREDFKILVADVSMDKVGAVFALEASRLSRSCTDWHRLLELCSLTGTLIIDEDGCYNPADFNDQLLLGLKGTMSQAELHFIKARLLGGKKNKARKGELCSPLPVGFCYDEERHIILDPDEQIRHCIKLIFKVFKETGSAYQVMRYFANHQIQFPKRAYGGIWNGKIVWCNLNHSRVIDVLKNPCYAGTYVYGRYKYRKKLSEQGTICMTSTRLPMHEWEVCIQNHHEGFIAWDEYLENQKKLQLNRTNETVLPTPAREGLALLQGLLICWCCGRRLTIRYTGNNGIYPCYQCHWKKNQGLATKECLSLRAAWLDPVVCQKVLDIIKTDQIKMAIQVFEELIHREQSVDKQWKMKIARIEYESQLAQKRYEEVDPSNRLVAATLETRWNESLVKLNEIQQQYQEQQKKNISTLSKQQKDQIVGLAKDLPRLWSAPSTNSTDRKRILRLLIKDITVERKSSSKIATLHLRWQGGATEDLQIIIPAMNYEKWRHPKELIERVKELAEYMTDEDIVEKFNKEGLKTNKGNSFTKNSIEWIRHKYHILSPRLQKPGELSINEVAKKFNVSHYVIRYWIEKNIIFARKAGIKLWISFDKKKEDELQNLVNHSTKIAKVRIKSQNSIVGGVV